MLSQEIICLIPTSHEENELKSLYYQTIGSDHSNAEENLPFKGNIYASFVA